MARIFALSDIHVDYTENSNWIHNLSNFDYSNDILILAGDITDRLPLMEKTFKALCCKFSKVLYVPGNHDLWVKRSEEECSFDKFNKIHILAENCGIETRPYVYKNTCFVPLYSWYDFTFGELDESISKRWSDFKACQWSGNFDHPDITEYFHAMNEKVIQSVDHPTVISYSHFMPRIDLMPDYIPPKKQLLYPVLGSAKLEEQIRQLNSKIHVYGHSHVNRSEVRDGSLYINNAFGYSHEKRITRKELLCIADI